MEVPVVSGMVPFAVAVVVTGMTVDDTFLAWVSHNIYRLHYVLCILYLVVAFPPVDIYRTVALVPCIVALLNALVLALMARIVVV